jgi:nucleoside triphosphate diphosphatase
MSSDQKSTGARFERAVEIMERLRAPDGCPWDREQSFDTIKPYTLEETYEVLDAIDRRDFKELPGELGDLLLQVLFYSQMAREEGRFSIDDVLERLTTKLVDRHPHVFGNVTAETSGEVLRNWEALKAEERRKQGKTHKDEDKTSILAGVSPGLPATLEALKLSSRAAQAGFDWPNIEGLFEKLVEETQELKEDLKEYPAPGPQPINRGIAGAGGAQVPDELKRRLEAEVGDLMFVLVNIARYLAVDPELALKRTNAKFRRRFRQVESTLAEQGRELQTASLEEMETLWQQAKGLEKK